MVGVEEEEDDDNDYATRARETQRRVTRWERRPRGPAKKQRRAVWAKGIA